VAASERPRLARRVAYNALLEALSGEAARPQSLEGILPSEFVVRDEFLGLGNVPYPHVLETLDEVCLGEQPEYVLVWGIGAGKTFLARLFLAWTAARVLDGLRDGTFWEPFELDPRTTVVELGCFAPIYEAARDVLFEGIQPMLLDSPWFQRNFPVDPRVRSRLVFMDRRSAIRTHWPLLIAPKGASESSRLGRNLYAVVVDESEFFMRSTGVVGDQVQELVESVSTRIHSRFGRLGKLLLISSAGHTDSLCQRKLEEARHNPEKVFAQRRAVWDVKPLDRWTTPEACDVTVPDPDGKGEIILEGVPVDLRNDFEANPRRALRDYGSVASAAMEPFDPMARSLFHEQAPPRGRGIFPLPEWNAGPYRVPDWVTPEACGVTGVYDSEWGERSTRAYFIHVDLALSGDACGIALAHPVWLSGEGVRIYRERRLERQFDPGQAMAVVIARTRAEREFEEETGEVVPGPRTVSGHAHSDVGVVVDWTSRIAPGDTGGQIDIASVREVVWELVGRGFNVTQVSYDGFQSAESLQAFRKRGVNAKLVSVDRTTGPYERLKEMLHTCRLFHGPSYWQEEYAKLDLLKGARVDHPAGGSKDVADAVAGVVSEAERWAERWDYGDVVSVEPQGDENELLERYGGQLSDMEQSLLERYGGKGDEAEEE